MKSVACAFLLLLVSASAFAFGPDGHRVVCHIALLELDAADRDEVVRLTRAFERPDGRRERSFERACELADEARRRARNGEPGWDSFIDFETWHFLNLPRTTRTVSESHCQRDCVLEGIEQDAILLRDGANDQARAEGLIFLGHWIADAHQPLHVSFRDDLGGNEILLTAQSDYDGHLHRVWDSGIIIAAMRSAGLGDALVYARRLHGTISNADRTRWLAARPIEWLQESYDIALLPAVEYCRFRTTPAGERCRSIGGRRTLTDAYQQQFEDDVETRLKQAGVRLAGEIRRALHPQ